MILSICANQRVSWHIDLFSWLPLPSHTIAILSFTVKSSIWLFSINCPRVSSTLYLVNSWVEKTTPLEARLQIARLNTFIVKSSSISEQFSRREVLRVLIIQYLFTNLPCLEKFSYITERIARMSLQRVLFQSNSQSIRKTVNKNFLVNGKQNLGFSRISQAMTESTQSIRNSVFWSWASSYQNNYMGTQS